MINSMDKKIILLSGPLTDAAPGTVSLETYRL